jgi:hypothetical protein
METYLQDVDETDIYYLTSKPDYEKRHFGWNSLDDPFNITWKYIYFIYNMNSILSYDWYIFIDDDTFVFIERLKNLLANYNKNDLYYIGNELDHIKSAYCAYMSGGGGYAISNGLYNLLYSYVKENNISGSYKHWCDDLCIGLWIHELKEKHDIKQIDNKHFLIDQPADEEELNNAITIHRTMTYETNKYYYEISKKETEDAKKRDKLDTVFVLATDSLYFQRAKRTIIDLRTKGDWKYDIVVITIGFHLNSNFKDFYNITEVSFPLIDKDNLLNRIGPTGFSNSDKREINKLNQWEKFHVFDDYFKKWRRVVFMDAGLRVLDSVKYLLALDYKNKFLAPKDGKYYENQTFKCQISYDNYDMVQLVKADFGESFLDEIYFLNCIWIYDTNILNICNKQEMIDAMNKYTLCRTNEMGIMNLLLTFKYRLWEPFPFKLPSGKILFDWCEWNNTNTTWKNYCYIKYPYTISFDDC